MRQQNWKRAYLNIWDGENKFKRRAMPLPKELPAWAQTSPAPAWTGRLWPGRSADRPCPRGPAASRRPASCSALPGHGTEPSSAVRAEGVWPSAAAPRAPSGTGAHPLPSAPVMEAGGEQPLPRAHGPSAVSPPPAAAGRTVTAQRWGGAEGHSPSGLAARLAKPRRVPASPAGSATASAGPRRRPGCQPFCKLRRPPPSRLPPPPKAGRAVRREARAGAARRGCARYQRGGSAGEVTPRGAGAAEGAAAAPRSTSR